MKVKALFIGSIGVVTETSEYQRRAYNQAMSENGMNWEWTPTTYKELLKSSGGKQRLQTLSIATQQPLTQEKIDQIHSRKTELAGQMIESDQLQPRPGLVKLIEQAKKAGAKVAWVTSTYEANTDALLRASNGALTKEHFDHIFHREDAENGKPSPHIYHKALEHFDLNAADCVAVEDSINSILSAKGAGIFTVATLGEYHDESVDNIADMVVDDLSQMNWERLCEQHKKSTQPVMA